MSLVLALIAGGVVTAFATGGIDLWKSQQAAAADVKKNNLEYVRSAEGLLQKFSDDEATISSEVDLIAQVFRRNPPAGSGGIAEPTDTLMYASGVTYSDALSKKDLDELMQRLANFQAQLAAIRKDINDVSLKSPELQSRAQAVGDFYEQIGREYQRIAPNEQALYIGKSVTSHAMDDFKATAQQWLKGE